MSNESAATHHKDVKLVHDSDGRMNEVPKSQDERHSREGSFSTRHHLDGLQPAKSSHS